MSFNPTGPPVEPVIWKPNKELSALALRRCIWVNCDAVHNIQPPEEWLATIIVGCYYQGLADGVKHMAKKVRRADSDKEAR